MAKLLDYDGLKRFKQDLDSHLLSDSTISKADGMGIRVSGGGSPR